MKNNFNLDLNILPTFDWFNYFLSNEKKLLHISYEDENTLSHDEVKLIKESLQIWQLGEGSPGNNLRKMIQKYAQKNNRHNFIEIMEKFLDDEKRHSQLLLQFMEFHDIKCKNKMFIDDFFRSLRKIMGLQCSIIMLVTGEIIALSYYHTLSKITTSKALPVICKQMLQDELMHIVLQSDTLYRFTLKNGRIKNILILIFRNVGMFIAVLIAWGHFKKIFKKGGHNLFSFYGTSQNVLKQSKQIIINWRKKYH